MRHEKINLTLAIYNKHLKTINGIEFTPREIDIISCILNRRAMSISSFLSIGPRAVETHSRNIRQKAGGLSGRESIIDFIEKSGKLLLIKNEYYLSLRIRVFFEELLKKVSKGKDMEVPVCFLVCEREGKYNPSLIPSLKDHLRRVGFEIKRDIKEGFQFFTQSDGELSSQNRGQILYIAPKNLDLVQLTRYVSQNPSVVFLLQNKIIDAEASEVLNNFNVINIYERENYYITFFEILKKILPTYNFDKLVEEFKSQTEEICLEKRASETFFKAEEPKAKTLSTKKRNFFIGGAIVLGVSIFYLLPLIFKESQKVTLNFNTNDQKSSVIRSDLSLPTESSLLNRPELITQIDNTFKAHNSIQTVALVGMGGAGKTTLARLYAHTQNLPIIWEINSETRESLKNSFEKLAQDLSKTEGDKKILREIQEINNPTEKEERIIQLVKDHLKRCSNWLLIFDNVEKFSHVQKYFPQDSNTWGVGKVILTTRDRNIQNNKYVSQVISIGELNSYQKLSLFTKIIKSQKFDSLTAAQIIDIKKFLEEIPPFPLDISVAAYYLKATNISYHRYLERLAQCNNDFENLQENILKESGDYTRTRYKIITQSLKQMIETKKDFGALLLFISMLDSQNIPRDLLNRYKNEAVIDEFFYNLRKYSFILNESSNSILEHTFSMHRSTQEISLAYLTKALNLEKTPQLLNSISDCIENYIADAINDENLKRMKLIISHCKKMLSHNDLLTDGIKGGIRSELGSIYYYFEYDDKAKEILEEALVSLNKNKIENNSRIANTLVYTGTTYRQLGNYKKAKDLLEKSLILYEKQPHKNYTRVAYALAHLGVIYRNLEEYAKAKDLLERSLMLYKKQFSEDHVRVAWTLGHLGRVYMMLGNGEKAKEILKKSLIIYKKHFSEDHLGVVQVVAFLGNVYRSLGDHEKAKDLFEQCFLAYRKHFGESRNDPWILMNLGDTYREFGSYEKAEEYLKQSLVTYKKYSPENYKGIAWALAALGRVYSELGNYEAAKNLIEKSLITYENHYGKDHIETAKVLGTLGQVYLLKNNFKTAEDILQKALQIIQWKKHPDVYMILESLADLYLKKAKIQIDKEHKQQSQNLKTQAIDYLKQALKIVKTHYPKNFRHIMRIQEKLNRNEKLE